GIAKSYEQSIARFSNLPGLHCQSADKAADPAKTEAVPAIFETDTSTWLSNESLREEVFGPAAILVAGSSEQDLLRVASTLPGSLTATIHGTPDDLKNHKNLVELLETRCGRLIFNGFPTGVEVSHAMHHGGPYPATADAKFTSVGTAAILRF